MSFAFNPPGCVPVKPSEVLATGLCVAPTAGKNGFEFTEG